MHGRTHGRTDERTENIYSIFRDKLLLLGEHVLWALLFCHFFGRKGGGDIIVESWYFVCEYVRWFFHAAGKRLFIMRLHEWSEAVGREGLVFLPCCVGRLASIKKTAAVPVDNCYVLGVREGGGDGRDTVVVEIICRISIGTPARNCRSSILDKLEYAVDPWVGCVEHGVGDESCGASSSDEKQLVDTVGNESK
jgi:hypothetical protein